MTEKKTEDQQEKKSGGANFGGPYYTVKPEGPAVDRGRRKDGVLPGRCHWKKWVGKGQPCVPVMEDERGEIR